MYNSVNIGPGNGLLLPDSTKPLPEPMLTYHERCSVAFRWEQFPITSICKFGLKMIFLKLLVHLIGANELTVGMKMSDPMFTYDH